MLALEIPTGNVDNDEKEILKCSLITSQGNFYDL